MEFVVIETLLGYKKIRKTRYKRFRFDYSILIISNFILRSKCLIILLIAYILYAYKTHFFLSSHVRKIYVYIQFHEDHLVYTKQYHNFDHNKEYSLKGT